MLRDSGTLVRPVPLCRLRGAAGQNEAKGARSAGCPVCLILWSPEHGRMSASDDQQTSWFCQLSGQVVQVPDGSLPEAVSGGGNQVPQRGDMPDVDGSPV